jgi:hypothetical protein
MGTMTTAKIKRFRHFDFVIDSSFDIRASSFHGRWTIDSESLRELICLECFI